MTLGAALIVLGVLIFVHELGHFWAAKAVGIGVPRFSLGLGPTTPLKWKRGETEYVVSWIPFGGYVKMATAEEDESMAALEGGSAEHAFPPERLFENKPLWARILVISAGVTMNALFAWLCYVVLAVSYGRVEDPNTRVAAVDSASLPGAAAGLRVLPFGTQITRINGDSMASWNDVVEAVLDPTRNRLEFEFAGAAPVVVDIPGMDTDRRVAVLTAMHRQIEPRVGLVVPSRPAARAGVAIGDLVLTAGGTPVRYWDQFVKAIESRPGDTVSLELRRRDSLLTVSVVPLAEEVRDESGQTRRVGKIGVGPQMETRYVRFGPVSALAEGVRRTLSDVGKVWFALKGLVLGRLPLRELGGPILIGQLSGQFARAGFDAFLSFMAFFSVNLAILNLLPVPVLDGGHLVFLLAEGVRGKPLSLKFRLRLSQAGMALLFAIMALALSNDVLRLLGR